VAANAPARFQAESGAPIQSRRRNDTKPEVFVRPQGIKPPDLRGHEALIVIEVADISLSYDLTIKAALYARFGVREYWVVEAWSLITLVHREPTASG
jgi:hypothetical protein